MTYRISDNGTDREMTAEETERYVQASSVLADDEMQRKVVAEEKASARQALLNKLGITEEEAQILLGGA